MKKKYSGIIKCLKDNMYNNEYLKIQKKQSKQQKPSSKKRETTHDLTLEDYFPKELFDAKGASSPLHLLRAVL